MAEDITSRFLNVISLFNGTLPIIAIQLQAYQVGEHVTLVNTKVLDELQRGLVDENEEAASATTDRAYWEKQKGSPKTVALMDRVFDLVREGDPGCELKYNKFYVGLAKDGRANNYVQFRPRRAHLLFEPKMQRSDEIDALLEASGLETLDYNTRWGYYVIRVTDKDLKTHADLFKRLIDEAREQRQG